MAYRTLHTFGTVSGNTAAIIRVNDQIVHNGPLESGVLFNFTTAVSLHGKVAISIEIIYGALTLTHNRVTYPALIKGEKGFVNMPQPIIQPDLPLRVTDSLTYNHYMFNGPAQWIVDVDTTNRIVVIDDFYHACNTGFIIADFQYDAYDVDIDKISDISKLK
jgi:hypothetical protein